MQYCNIINLPDLKITLWILNYEFSTELVHYSWILPDSVVASPRFPNQYNVNFPKSWRIWFAGPRCIPVAYIGHKSEYALLRELNKFSFTSTVNGIFGSGVKCPPSAATRRYFLKPSSSAYAQALPGSLRTRRDGLRCMLCGVGEVAIYIYIWINNI